MRASLLYAQLSFVGLDPNGGDNTAFLDAVAINSVTPEPGAAVSDNGAAVANGGTINFGAAPGVPVTQTSTVTNTGTATLGLSSVSVSGTGFTLSAPLGSSALAPGASTTFSVQFSAASAGSYSGTVAFDTNDPNNTTFSFNLAGTM